MKVHKFKCDQGHEFFIPLELPIDLMDFVKMAERMTCPICQSREINIFAQEMKIGKFEVGEMGT